MISANQPASLIYSKISAGMGSLILAGPFFGIPESELTKALGIVLAASGLLAMALWKILSWLSKLFFARIDIINGLPEKLAEYESRAIERDRLWQARLIEWERRFEATDAKLDASMKLQGAIVDGLVKQIDGVAAFQRREARKLYEVERWLREGHDVGVLKRRQISDEDSDPPEDEIGGSR